MESDLSDGFRTIYPISAFPWGKPVPWRGKYEEKGPASSKHCLLKLSLTCPPSEQRPHGQLERGLVDYSQFPSQEDRR